MSISRAPTTDRVDAFVTKRALVRQLRTNRDEGSMICGTGETPLKRFACVVFGSFTLLSCRDLSIPPPPSKAGDILRACTASTVRDYTSANSNVGSLDDVASITCKIDEKMDDASSSRQRRRRSARMPSARTPCRCPRPSLQQR
jgi:hypothetical protein